MVRKRKDGMVGWVVTAWASNTPEAWTNPEQYETAVACSIPMEWDFRTSDRAFHQVDALEPDLYVVEVYINGPNGFQRAYRRNAQGKWFMR